MILLLLMLMIGKSEGFCSGDEDFDHEFRLYNDSRPYSGEGYLPRGEYGFAAVNGEDGYRHKIGLTVPDSLFPHFEGTYEDCLISKCGCTDCKIKDSGGSEISRFTISESFVGGTNAGIQQNYPGGNCATSDCFYGTTPPKTLTDFVAAIQTATRQHLCAEMCHDITVNPFYIQTSGTCGNDVIEDSDTCEEAFDLFDSVKNDITFSYNQRNGQSSFPTNDDFWASGCIFWNGNASPNLEYGLQPGQGGLNNGSGECSEYNACICQRKYTKEWLEDEYKKVVSC